MTFYTFRLSYIKLVKIIIRQERSRSTKMFIYPVVIHVPVDIKTVVSQEKSYLFLWCTVPLRDWRNPRIPEGDRGSRSHRRRVEIRVSSEIWMAIICEQKGPAIRSFRRHRQRSRRRGGHRGRLTLSSNTKPCLQIAWCSTLQWIDRGIVDSRAPGAGAAAREEDEDW